MPASAPSQAAATSARARLLGGVVIALVVAALVGAAAMRGPAGPTSVAKASAPPATTPKAPVRTAASAAKPAPGATMVVHPAGRRAGPAGAAGRRSAGPARAGGPAGAHSGVKAAAVPRPRPVVTAPPAPPPPRPVVTAPAPVAALPRPANPAVSRPPSQAFDQACFTGPVDVSACNGAALADINQARALEGLGPMALPGDFSSLGTVGQLIAVSNAERTSRGLPVMPENASLDSYALAGAARGADPIGPSGFNWASIYSVGEPSALAADYSWMYDDGPGSINVDCPTSGGSGCWGHRDNILCPWAGQAGAGVADAGGQIVLTVLFVKTA